MTDLVNSAHMRLLNLSGQYLNDIDEALTPDPVEVRNPSDNWRVRASCNGMDPEIFFPERGDNPNPAKAICANCQVKDECLEDAIANTERTGIWGGTSERERRRIRRRRGMFHRSSDYDY